MIRYGGCGEEKGVKAEFNVPENIDLDDIVVSNTDKTYIYAETSSCLKANGCFKADMFIGKKDRFGFAIPKGSNWSMDRTSLYQSRTQA